MGYGNGWYHGDNYCDDYLNNEACDWDGGDCCGDNVNTALCNDCECLDPNQQPTTTTTTTTTNLGKHFEERYIFKEKFQTQLNIESK